MNSVTLENGFIFYTINLALIIYRFQSRSIIDKYLAYKSFCAKKVYIHTYTYIFLYIFYLHRKTTIIIKIIIYLFKVSQLLKYNYCLLKFFTINNFSLHYYSLF